MKNQRGMEMFYICSFLTLVFLVASFFFYRTDVDQADSVISEKQSQQKKIEAAIQDLNEQRKSDYEDLRDTVNVQEELAKKVLQIEKAQSELHKKITDTESHLDIRIAKLSEHKPKKPEPLDVRILGGITLERVVASSSIKEPRAVASPAGPKKGLGKSFNDVRQEGAK